jgi:hypothetical protein
MQYTYPPGAIVYSDGTCPELETWTRTDVIAVLSPDNGDGTATVAAMTYSVAPKPGELVTSHGETVETVRRDPPATPGAVWAAPYAVNCGRCGHVTSTRDQDLAQLAATSHIAAHRSKVRVYAEHGDPTGAVMCSYHAPLITGRPGVASHLELCAETGAGIRCCSPMPLPDAAICEQCARCGVWSTSLSVWLV